MEKMCASSGDVSLSFQEFLEEPSLMSTCYCNLIKNQEDIERLTYATTDKAIKDLLYYCRENPYIYKDILLKRKFDSVQNTGLFSSFKAFVCKTIFGKKYLNSLLSDEEFDQRFSNLLRGIEVIQEHNRESFCKHPKNSLSLFANSEVMHDLKVKNRIHTFNDIKENSTSSSLKNVSTSFCRPSLHPRLSMRNMAETSKSDKSVATPAQSSIAIVPPPPPPPLPPTTNAKVIQSNKILTPRKRKFEQTDFREEKKTMKKQKIPNPPKLTLHEEILRTNHKNRLRSTNMQRSPGGTPLINPSVVNPNEDDLVSNLKKILKEKFANVRSPDQSASSSFNQSYNSFTD